MNESFQADNKAYERFVQKFKSMTTKGVLPFLQSPILITNEGVMSSTISDSIQIFNAGEKSSENNGRGKSQSIESQSSEEI